MQLSILVTELTDLITFNDSSDTKAKRWLNQAYKQLAYEAMTIAATADTESLVANQQEYDFPSDCYSDGIIWVAFDKERIPFLTMTELADMDEDWQTETATEPDYYYVRGKKYGFYPVPSANDSNAITVYYYQLPADMSQDADTPSLLDSDLHDYIVYGAAHKAAIATLDPRAGYFKGLFEEGLERAKQRGLSSHGSTIQPIENWG